MTAEEYVKHYASGQGGFESVSVDVALKAIEYAKQEAKQQMMANAFDVTITGIREYKEENEVDFTLMLEKGTIPYKLEEDIKVIIIKED